MHLGIGVQTIIWGEDFEHGLEYTLNQIQRIGFKGVEFAQVPGKLGDPEKFEELLAKRGLALLGLAGGSLEKRLTFCRRLKRIRPLYLYLQKWDEEFAPKAIEEGYTLALHPHLYSPIDRFELAVKERELHDSPLIKFLPDTAHLYLANDNMLEILQKHSSDSIAIHFKDWTPEFGWSAFTYARGFTELGNGRVPLRKTWDWMQTNYKGWVVVEQDSTEMTPEASLRISKLWLHGERPDRLEGERILSESPTYSFPQMRQTDKMVESLFRISRDSLRGVERLYASILESFAQLCECKCANLWEISPRNEKMTLKWFWQPKPPPYSRKKQVSFVTTLEMAESLSGEAVAEQTIRAFKDVTQSKSRRSFKDNELVRAFDLKGMISIPIANLSNINQPELLINLFPSSNETIESEGDATGLVPRELEAEFKALAKHLVVSVEEAWEELRTAVNNEINWDIGKASSVNGLLKEMLKPIRFHVKCEQVSIFLVHPAEIQMELRATTHPQDAMPIKKTYAKGEDLPGCVWKTRSLFNSRTDKMPGFTPKTSSDLLMPIYRLGPPLGEVMGVIWCQDRKVGEDSLPAQFSVTDEIILDAIQASLVSHLDRMQAAEWRSQAIRQVTHELKDPILISRGALERAQDELDEMGIKLSEGFLEDTDNYMQLMNQVVEKASFLKPAEGVMLGRRERVQVLQHIVAPTVDYSRVILKKMKIEFEKMSYQAGTFDKFPAMFLDRARFQQVIFNLLNNAIKYAKKIPNSTRLDPALFKIRVIGEYAGSGACLIRVRDWGVGIPEEMWESIFKQGVRGPESFTHDTTGDGIGLWMVREILRAHGASIKVNSSTTTAEYTEFQINLPSSLQELPKA